MYVISKLPVSQNMMIQFSFIGTGRGNNTYAYTHSVGESHHVFLNLHTLRFYCLPDNYEIIGKFTLLYCHINCSFTFEKSSELRVLFMISIRKSFSCVLYLCRTPFCFARAYSGGYFRKNFWRKNICMKYMF
jgi:hypothetical protein